MLPLSSKLCTFGPCQDREGGVAIAQCVFTSVIQDSVFFGSKLAYLLYSCSTGILLLACHFLVWNEGRINIQLSTKYFEYLDEEMLLYPGTLAHL